LKIFGVDSLLVIFLIGNIIAFFNFKEVKQKYGLSKFASTLVIVTLTFSAISLILLILASIKLK